MRWLFFLLMPFPASADALIATQVIPARSVVGPSQVTVVSALIDGALSLPEEAVGQQARITIYPGRPLHAADLGAPTLVARNEAVVLRFAVGGLSIVAEGRALDSGAEGESVRALNLASRNIVSGRVAADGSLLVNP